MRPNGVRRTAIGGISCASCELAEIAAKAYPVDHAEKRPAAGPSAGMNIGAASEALWANMPNASIPSTSSPNPSINSSASASLTSVVVPTMYIPTNAAEAARNAQRRSMRASRAGGGIKGAARRGVGTPARRSR